MSWRNWGNPPIQSTALLTADPSTTALLAEITGLTNNNYEVRFIVGASTGAIWVLDDADWPSVQKVQAQMRAHGFRLLETHDEGHWKVYEVPR